MKIQEQPRVNIGEARPAAARSTTGAGSFQQIMNARAKELTHEHFDQMLSDIEQQGLKLSETPNFRELGKYKGLIKKFMEEVTKKGVGLYESDSWDPYGGNKTLKTVQVIDQKLIDLAHSVLQQQDNGLAILERIGEIKGLLINLYR